MNPEIQNYVQTCRAQGFADDQIRAQLIQAGWAEEAVNAVIPVAASIAAISPSVTPDLPLNHAQAPAVQDPASAASPVQGETVFGEAAESPAVAALPVTNSSAPMVHFEEVPVDMSAGPEVNPTIIQPKRGPSRALVLGGTVLGALLLFGGVGVAFAENGYLPGFSRLYRQTPLPLAWGGTNAKASTSLGKMLLATSEANISGGSTSISAKNDRLDAEKDVKLSALGAGDSRALGSACAGEECLDSYENFDPSSLFPFTLLADLSFSRDALGNTALSSSVDLAEIAANLPDPSQAATAPSKVTFSLGAFPDAKSAYFKSSLLPHSSADAMKWVKSPLSDDLASDIKKPSEATKAIDPADLKELGAVVDEITEDRGIVRKDGGSYAAYHMRMDAAALRRLASLKVLQDYKYELETFASENSGVSEADIYIHPRSGLLHGIDFSSSATDADANLKTELKVSQTLSYGALSLVAPADADSVEFGDGDELMDAYTERLMLWSRGADVSEVGAHREWFGYSRFALSVRDLITGMLAAYNSAETTVESGDDVSWEGWDDEYALDGSGDAYPTVSN